MTGNNSLLNTRKHSNRFDKGKSMKAMVTHFPMYRIATKRNNNFEFFTLNE